MKCVLFSGITSLLVSLSSFCQSTIIGEIRDEGGRPVSAATVLLKLSKDSSLVKFTSSDKQGRYEFDNIGENNYFIAVSSVGYSPKYTGYFTVPVSGLTVPAIILQSSDKNLQEVTVTARRPLIENKIDRTIVNVEASPTNAGANALEVLGKSPGVSVDRDGNISIKGRQGVIILLDGKQTYLSGQDLANLLRNMPASQLDQIEIMTQPSAKYDASGNAGLLNLKTKKSNQQGFNGGATVAVAYGNYFKSPGSANFNYRKGKVNAFASLSYVYWKTDNDVKIIRKFSDNTTQDNTLFVQTSDQIPTTVNIAARMGLDYAINKKTTIGAGINGLSSNRHIDIFSASNMYNANTGHLDSTNTGVSKSKDPFKNMGINLNFRKLLKQAGSEFTADADYLHYSTRRNLTTDNYTYNTSGALVGTPLLLRGVLPSDIIIYSGKADYVRPLKNNGRFEAGIKSSLVKTDNDAPYEIFDLSINQWKTDEIRSEHFLYNENINAAYINYSRQIKKWGLQLGLRFEHTHSEGQQLKTNQKFPRDYAQLFPTGYLSYGLNEKNNFSLSYGRRIERPNYRDMNPFRLFVDQYTYLQGNPFLTPQFTHNIELSHNLAGKLNTTFNYTVVTDIINDILRQDDNSKVMFQTKDNIARSRNIGIAISYNTAVNKWWTMNLYMNAYTNHYEGIVNNIPLNVDMASITGTFSQVFRFGKGWNAELSGDYQSKTQEGGLILADPMGSVSFGIGKQVLKGKGTLRLNLNDPFALKKFRGYTKFGTIDSDITNRFENRRIGLNFTYRFGKLKAPAQRKHTGSAQDEQSRVGQG